MKNIQDFKTFLLEINRFKDKYHFTGNNFDHDINDYEYSEGEIVTLQHPTWKEKYQFKVIIPGKKPTLKQIDGPREIVLERPNDFLTVIPDKMDLNSPSKKSPKGEISPREPKPEWLRPMTQVEFKRLCRETVSGHEYDDHSIFYDLAEGQVKTNTRLQDYLKKMILKDYVLGSGFIKMRDLIERFVNELEVYAK